MEQYIHTVAVVIVLVVVGVARVVLLVGSLDVEVVITMISSYISQLTFFSNVPAGVVLTVPVLLKSDRTC
jgi:hypothetical protein